MDSLAAAASSWADVDILIEGIFASGGLGSPSPAADALDTSSAVDILVEGALASNSLGSSFAVDALDTSSVVDTVDSFSAAVVILTTDGR